MKNLHIHLLIFQDITSQIDFYNSRINFFYGSKIEKVNFRRIQNEISDRLNEKNAVVTSEDEDKLETDSPLSIITGNSFKVFNRTDQTLFGIQIRAN